MKKYAISLSLIILAILFVFNIYSRNYCIRDTENQKKLYLENFINRGNDAVPDRIDMKKEIDIDNKKYIIFTLFDFTLGEAELTKGVNGKYKIEYTGYGGSNFRYDLHKTNKGTYLVLFGKNIGMKIAYYIVKIGNTEYKMNTLQQEFFINSIPTQDSPDPNNIAFYDKNGADITRAVR